MLKKYRVGLSTLSPTNKKDARRVFFVMCAISFVVFSVGGLIFDLIYMNFLYVEGATWSDIFRYGVMTLLVLLWIGSANHTWVSVRDNAKNASKSLEENIIQETNLWVSGRNDVFKYFQLDQKSPEEMEKTSVKTKDVKRLEKFILEDPLLREIRLEDLFDANLSLEQKQKIRLACKPE